MVLSESMATINGICKGLPESAGPCMRAGVAKIGSRVSSSAP